MKAREIMTCDHIWVCSEDTDVREAARLMAEHNVGIVPVLDRDGRLEGVVTDRDICCRIVANGRSFETPVSEVMSSAPLSVDVEADLKDIEQIMQGHKVRRLMVVDANRNLMGIVSMADLARHCHGLWKEHHLAETLEEVSTGPGPGGA